MGVRDDEDWIEEAMARRWTPTAGLMMFDAGRVQISGGWIAPTDVERC